MTFPLYFNFYKQLLRFFLKALHIAELFLKQSFSTIRVCSSVRTSATDSYNSSFNDARIWLSILTVHDDFLEISSIVKSVATILCQKTAYPFWTSFWHAIWHEIIVLLHLFFSYNKQSGFIFRPNVLEILCNSTTYRRIVCLIY